MKQMEQMELWKKYLGHGYEFVDLLKTSPTGMVALVYDKIGRQVCVMKQLEPRAEDIYRAIRDINSPFLPTIHRLFVQEGQLIVIEEFIDGRTLADLLAYGELLDEAAARHILEELCLCLRTFHERNIIHRDLKPSNIMLTKKNEVRLIDFGIARTVKEGDDPDTEFLGTKGYAPPEQYGFGQTDARSDLYSLGITMRRMLGKDYHGYLQGILDRCTALDPANRYASAAELLEALEAGHQRRLRKRTAIIIGAAFLLAGALLWGWASHPTTLPTETPSEPQEAVSGAEMPPASGTAPAPEAASSTEPPTTPSPKQPNPVTLPSSVALPSPPLPQELPSQAAPPAPSSPRDPRTNRVFGTLYLNGAPFDAEASSIPTEEWTTWQQNGDFTYFPDGWAMRLHLENGWEKDYENPVLRISLNGTEQSIPLPTLPSGESVDIDIPLGGTAFSSSLYPLNLSVNAGEEPPNAPPLHWDLQFYLSGWAKYRMELARGKKE